MGDSIIKSYALKRHLVYLDYFSATKDDKNGLQAKLAKDAVHPNLSGYKVMEPLVEKAIHETL